MMFSHIRNRKSAKSVNKTIGSKKGQFFSYDAIVAGLMYAVLLTILYVYWSSLRSTMFTQIDGMFSTSMAVSNLLLTTGNPVNWTASNVNQIGLTTGFNSLELDPNKVAYFQFLANSSLSSYYNTSSRIGVAPYQFYITIDANPPIDIGNPPLPTATGQISIVRPVIYEGNSSNLTVTIWSNSTVS